MITRLRILLSIAFLCILQYTLAQHPATEVRAIWITTNWGLDMPSTKLPKERQKEEIKSMLNELAQMNINTIFFQTRVRGDVTYQSAIEPLSPHYNWGKQSSRADDLLSFMIKECHDRGMECHAWFVVYPLGTKSHVSKQTQSIANKQRQLCKYFNGEWYLDPGNPGTQTYILSLVDEIVTQYDIDGIHLDYIRYPDKGAKFPDSDTFKKYGNGQSLDNWRRGNVNNLVSKIYDRVKVNKPWVQVSSSPLGKHKALSTRGEWTGYNSVYQDAVQWMNAGKHDAIYPMMYYKDENFDPYLKEWLRLSNGRLVVPGLGVYRLLPEEGNWDVRDIQNQIEFSREEKAQGQALYRAKNILSNIKNVQTVTRNYYQHPAKLPSMTWLSTAIPENPGNIEIFRTDDGLICIRWESADENEDLTYTVYTAPTDHFDLNDAQNIIATGIHKKEILLKVEDSGYGMYYTVTASNRFHNESAIANSAFFVHSDLIK